MSMLQRLTNFWRHYDHRRSHGGGEAREPGPPILSGISSAKNTLMTFLPVQIFLFYSKISMCLSPQIQNPGYATECDKMCLQRSELLRCDTNMSQFNFLKSFNIFQRNRTDLTKWSLFSYLKDVIILIIAISVTSNRWFRYSWYDLSPLFLFRTLPVKINCTSIWKHKYSNKLQ